MIETESLERETTDVSEVEDLKNRVAELEAELEEQDKKLQASKKMHMITAIAQVEPADYNDLKKQVRKLEGIVHNYRKVYATGGIATIVMLIEDYKSFSKKRMGEICDELMASSYDNESISAAADFSSYLEDIKMEIDSLTSVYKQGHKLNRPNYGQAKFDVDVIKKLLNANALLKCDESRLEALHELLAEHITALNDFFQK